MEGSNSYNTDGLLISFDTETNESPMPASTEEIGDSCAPSDKLLKPHEKDLLSQDPSQFSGTADVSSNHQHQHTAETTEHPHDSNTEAVTRAFNILGEDFDDERDSDLSSRSDPSEDTEYNFMSVDGSYFSHKFLQDILLRISTDKKAPREVLDEGLVEKYKNQILHIFNLFDLTQTELRHNLEQTLAELRRPSGQLVFNTQLSMTLYADTVDMTFKQLHRVVTSWLIKLAEDILQTDRTIPVGMSESYLFCRIVSLCLKIRDSWWKAELYLMRSFLRLIKRCRDLSDEWQQKLQRINLTILRTSNKFHHQMDKKLALWEWAREVRIPELKLSCGNPHILNVFVEEQLTGDVSSLMTTFIFEIGYIACKTLYETKKKIAEVNVKSSTTALESAVQATWNTYVQNIRDQSCVDTVVPITSNMESCITKQIGQSLDRYMQLIQPLHYSLMDQWKGTYDMIDKKLYTAAKSTQDDDHKRALKETRECVGATSNAVLRQMQLTFEDFEKKVQLINNNVEAFSKEMAKILE